MTKGDNVSNTLIKFGVDGLTIESNRLDEYINYINENSVKSIFIYYMQYDLTNVSFLTECPTLESITINAPINDFKGLYEMANLKELILSHDLADSINFSRLSMLKLLILSLKQNPQKLSYLTNLERLVILDYKPKSRNLKDLPLFRNLTEIELVKSNITSINGIEKFENLSKIEFHYLSKLEDIKNIHTFSNKLKELRMENCKRIIFEDYLSCLKELEALALVKCGNLSSIKFIRNMNKLRDFIFPGTDVLDGDVSPCFGLEYVHFTNKKHFNHKENEFNNTF
ncbi:hypothetical protein ACFCYN_21665 [Gottfriedia sp. NPDC056225]|uniref:hypothetical protein n=1 Tax=Gottfriedia sp. NPDC056225 TaxID=3345751 RepID=UPI0035DF16D9